jgi:hypothetical protein
MFMFDIVPCQVSSRMLTEPCLNVDAALGCGELRAPGYQDGLRRDSRATRRSSSAQTSAIRPEITIRPAPAAL